MLIVYTNIFTHYPWKFRNHASWFDCKWMKRTSDCKWFVPGTVTAEEFD